LTRQSNRVKKSANPIVRVARVAETTGVVPIVRTGGSTRTKSAKLQQRENKMDIELHIGLYPIIIIAATVIGLALVAAACYKNPA